jgi:4-amino-4-deoxy-L-arabinose transferase-like glycosyltransferase
MRAGLQTVLAAGTMPSRLRHWWSTALFPGPVAPAREPRGELLHCLERFAPILPLAVAALLFFSRLHCPLLEPDEVRYAEIPREMLAAGHVLVPELHGEPYYHKPPLLYWLVMAADSACGVHDWAARLVPASCALLTVLLTYLWGRFTVGGRPAFAGALVLALSVRFVYLGRMLTMDGLLCLCVIAALAAAHGATREGPRLRRAAWLLSALACGLGILTKGPVALALVMPPVLCFQLLTTRAVWPRPAAWAAYVAVALAVAAPWYVALCLHDPAFAREFFWTHNVVRYVAPLDHQKPFWYYVPDLLLGMMPWSLLLLPLAAILASRSVVVARCRPPALGLFLLDAVWCVGFYSTAGCKRPGYVLPAMPPLSLAIGWCLCALPTVTQATVSALARAAHARVGWAALAIVTAAGVAANTAGAVVGMQPWTTAVCVAGVAIAGCTALIAWRHRLGHAGLWAGCAAVTFVLLFAAVQNLLPGYARKFSLRRQVEPLRTLAAKGGVPVVCYPHRWESVTFYLGRDDERTYAPTEQAALVHDLDGAACALAFVKSDDRSTHYLTDLRGALPPSLEFVPVGPPGIVTAGLIRARTAMPPTCLTGAPAVAK